MTTDLIVLFIQQCSLLRASRLSYMVDERARQAPVMSMIRQAHVCALEVRPAHPSCPKPQHTAL